MMLYVQVRYIYNRLVWDFEQYIFSYFSFSTLGIIYVIDILCHGFSKCAKGSAADSLGLLENFEIFKNL